MIAFLTIFAVTALVMVLALLKSSSNADDAMRQSYYEWWFEQEVPDLHNERRHRMGAKVIESLADLEEVL